jgi:hypothetical protein
MWKKLESNPNYEVSIDGEIRNSKTGRILVQYRDDRGYLNVGLRVNKKRKNYWSHRLVAETFIEGYSNSLEVNHINGIKYDNRVSNLECISKCDNLTKRIFKGCDINLIQKIVDLHKNGLTVEDIFLQLRV